jgi:hypothetical protein
MMATEVDSPSLARKRSSIIRRAMESVEGEEASAPVYGTDESKPSETIPADIPDNANPKEGFFYEFIGECYVHGMMDGEAIKHQNDEDIRAQIFELR